MNSDEKMIRKQIYLKSKQSEKIKYISACHGKSEAEIIREAIDQYHVKNEGITDDPLKNLIGMVETDQEDGSVEHDRDIYFRSENS